VRTIFLQDIGHHGDTHPARSPRETGEAKPRHQVGSIPFFSRAWPAPTAPAVLVGDERAVPATPIPSKQINFSNISQRSMENGLRN